MNGLVKTIDIGDGALDRFGDWCREMAVAASPRIVADRRTWEVLGKRVAAAFEERGITAQHTIFGNDALAADGEGILGLLADLGANETLLVAAGSGTITDIVRFVAARTNRPFVSLPSAPSVDAWASSVSALILGGTKVTVAAAPPLAIFADTGILAQAPAPMVAAGFGDMLCKPSAVADWRLGALLWNEPFDENIAQRSLSEAGSAIKAVDAIGARTKEGIHHLMVALVESGLCMAAAGHSRPASGAEHHYSHFWEEELLRAGRPPLLHGLKVGVGTVVAAGLWDRVKALSSREASRLLEGARPPGRAREVERIRALFRERAEGIIRSQRRFLALEGHIWQELVKRLMESWDRIQSIAAVVPDVETTVSLLVRAGCPKTPRELGLGEEEVERALAGAHWLRDRFTIGKLSRVMFGDCGCRTHF